MFLHVNIYAQNYIWLMSWSGWVPGLKHGITHMPPVLRVWHAYSVLNYIYDHILPKRIIYDHIFQSYMFNFLKGVYSRGSSIMFCLRVPIFLNFFSKGVFFSQDFCGSCVHVNVYILQVIDINLVVVIHAVFLRIIYMWS